ncbi:MAG: hypothetical protein QW356_07795 [Candidatus Hadarchaeales archaeon]
MISDVGQRENVRLKTKRTNIKVVLVKYAKGELELGKTTHIT